MGSLVPTGLKQYTNAQLRRSVGVMNCYDNWERYTLSIRERRDYRSNISTTSGSYYVESRRDKDTKLTMSKEKFYDCREGALGRCGAIYPTRPSCVFVT